jgi:radical SAM superfamily enzyme
MYHSLKVMLIVSHVFTIVELVSLATQSKIQDIKSTEYEKMKVIIYFNAYTKTFKYYF